MPIPFFGGGGSDMAETGPVDSTSAVIGGMMNQEDEQLAGGALDQEDELFKSPWDQDNDNDSDSRDSGDSSWWDFDD